MQRLHYILIAAFAAVVLIISNTYAAPKALIENPVFDAGQIPQGKKIEHDFIITNTGDEVLTYKIKGC
ncbi:MAG: hypothetical protein JW920_04370 [Deltaproteobacteria bacterium]|nr:hypothetical protein [Deltaproteobacteria bacterium]